jgi:hypothetical protein
MGRPPIPQASRRRLDDAVAQLRALVPDSWDISGAAPAKGDGTIRFRSPAGVSAEVAVEAKDRFEPRDVASLALDDEPRIVVSRWLSPRARDLLRQRGVSYIDSTGNVDLRVDRAGIFVRADGADRDPRPRPTKGPTLRGPRAWALLRTLAEVDPPFGVRDLSTALDVDAGYVSRVLRVLEDELLIERLPRGPVTTVDWDGILRKIVSTYSLLDSNETTTWVAAGGPEQLLRDLRGKRAGRWVVSGSFGARRLSPIAAPEVALIYADDVERVAKVGRLLPATRGSNVVLAEPYDSIVFERTWDDDDIAYVSPAQLTIDCLTGPGRMPAEGEALLQWMRRNARRWRTASLDATLDGVA